MGQARKTVCKTSLSGGVVVKAASENPAMDDIYNPPKPRVPLQCGQYRLGILRGLVQETSDALRGLDVHHSDFDMLAQNLVRRMRNHRRDLLKVIDARARAMRGL